MKKLFTTLVVLLFVLTLIGCDAEQAETTAPAKTTAAESESKGESFTGKFMDFVKKKLSAEYVVTYEITADDQKYTMKQYVSGKNMRTDMTLDQGEARTYILDKVFYTCMNTDGWQCFKMESPETEQLATDYMADVEMNPDNYDISFSGTKTVAGEKAFCFDVTVKQEGLTADVSQCFSAEGVPLYIKADAKGTSMEMIAKSYSKNVKDSDFTVPAKAQDVDTLLAQYE
jgi:predicted small lipoprotein YifL